MDSDLLAFGIDMTHELDRRFGLAPKIAMSQVRPAGGAGSEASFWRLRAAAVQEKA